MIKTQSQISCIIPAYNERRNISQVLDVVCKIGWIDEIIVVDDGSTDHTPDLVANYGCPKLQLIRSKTNRGKGDALARGIKKARFSLLLLLDADLVGLKETHLLELISPVLFSKSARLSLGVFAISKLNENAGTKIANRAIPAISGQRVIRKKDLPNLKQLKKYKYGADLLITRSIPKNSIKIVKLPGLSQVSKEDKTDLFSAMRSRAKMYYQISKAFRLH